VLVHLVEIGMVQVPTLEATRGQTSVNLPQMLPPGGSICMGFDWRNYRAALGLVWYCQGGLVLPCIAFPARFFFEFGTSHTMEYGPFIQSQRASRRYV